MERGKLKALEAHYDLFTRVEGDMKPGFPSVLLLEPGLAGFLLPKVTIFGRKKLMLPSYCDQATVRPSFHRSVTLS